MRRAAACVMALAGACSSSKNENAQPAPAAPPPQRVLDAAVPGITEIRPYDPASGMHLDDDVGAAQPAAPAVPANRPGRPIDVTLRSSPTGAQAAVDGVIVGNTPTYWMGEANGREHEFTFVLKGHAIARYRFVPITSGVVHAKLERVVEAGTAAMPPPPIPQAPPRAVPEVAPPPGPVAPPVDGAIGSASTGSSAVPPVGPQP